MSGDRTTFSLSAEVYARLASYSIARGVSLSRIVDELLEPVLCGEIPAPMPEAAALRAVRTRRARGQLGRPYKRRPTSTARVAAHLMQLCRVTSVAAARTMREVTGLQLSSSAVRCARLKIYGGGRV